MAKVHEEHQKKLDSSRLILRICTHTRADYPVPNNAISGKDGYFVLSPNPTQNNVAQGARVTIMDTWDFAIADEQGPGIPEWSLSGQFLITPIRNLTNYGWQRALEHHINHYLEENKERGASRKPLLRMELYDNYSKLYWVVVPLNVPRGTKDSSNPTLERYDLKLRGVRPVVMPASTVDALNQNLTTSPNAELRATCPFFSDGSCSLSNCEHNKETA